MKKLQLEAKEERKRRFTALASIIIVVTCLLAIFQLVLSNRLASYGDALAKLDSRQKELVLDNERLTKEIAKAGSLQTISQKAQALSMNSAASILVVEEAESVAFLH